MDETRLLAIIEVPYVDRVRCTALGCGNSVYKRVHIIRHGDCLRVYGSTCFAREFDGHQVQNSSPRLTSSAGRLLTAEERQLLLSNTENLIERFEAERALEQDRLKTAVLPSALLKKKGLARVLRANGKSRPPQFTPAERASAEPEARRLLNAKFFGLDFDTPGFSGLLQMEIDRILREGMI